MRRSLTIIVGSLVSILLASPAFAEDTKPKTGEPPPPVAHTSSATTVVESQMLAHIKPGAAPKATQGAGASREVKLDAKNVAPGQRTAASPRTLRKLEADKTLASIGPAIAACAEKNPSATPTSIGLTISIAGGGSVDAADATPGAKIAAPLLACTVAAVKTAHFGAPGGAGTLIARTVTVPGHPEPASK